MERVTVRVVRGAPDPWQTAGLMAVLAVALDRARDGGGEREVRPLRPLWRSFGGHGTGGWGRS